MILQAGDLGIELDTGTNAPGAILQRKEPDGWQDYRVNGKPVFSPVDINTLPPGKYRVVPTDLILTK